MEGRARCTKVNDYSDFKMGNKSSLLLREEEIAQIQEETGCEYSFLLYSTRSTEQCIYSSNDVVNNEKKSKVTCHSNDVFNNKEIKLLQLKA